MAVAVGGEPAPVLFGVVRFDAGEDRQVAETVITFDSPASADRFALRRGWQDYEVTPLRFFVSDLPPPAGSRRYLGSVLASWTEQTRGGR